MATHTYVCDDTDAQAYEGSDSDGGFNDDIAEFTSGDYDKIKVDDLNSVTDLDNTAGEYQYHRFDFTIIESIANIIQIDITWKGYGRRGDASTSKHSLWVKDTGSWSEKDSGSNGLVKDILTAQKTSNFDEWISGGHLHCAAQSDDAAGGGMFQDSVLKSYYVEVVITYKVPSVHIKGGKLLGCSIATI